MQFPVGLSFLAVAATAATAQTKPLEEGPPESAGFSSERLHRITAGIDDWIASGRIAGAVALVARNGTIVYYRAAGYDDVATKRPLPKDGIFRIASQTKAITSVAAMMLYEEGKFLLDDPVSKYIPSFAGARVLKEARPGAPPATVAAKRPVTIRDLLRHTAGIGYPLWGTPGRLLYGKLGFTAGHTFGFDDSGKTLADLIPRLGTVPLLNQPGEKWTYGFGVDVLGYLVEVWSGMSLDEFFRRRIFEPLEMRDTHFNLPPEKAGRLVSFFRVDSLGNHLAKQTALEFPQNMGTLPMDFPLRKKAYFSGGGGLSSTIVDYAVFLQMLLNGGEYGHVRLLAPSTIRLMTVNQIGGLGIPEGKFGLGFSVVPEEDQGRFPARPGTFGWGGALTTKYWVDPAERLLVLVYRQMWGSRDDLDERVRALVYQAMVR